MNNMPTQVDKMIEAVMQIEREYLSDRLSADASAKKTAVNAILEELERVMTDED